MNKSVLIANIQKIMTNIEQTIENLTSIINKEKCYSKDQIQKMANLLSARIENDDSYTNLSIKSSNLELLIKKLQGQKGTLKKLISEADFNVYSLNLQVEGKKTKESEEQREYEILADSLNISENDEEIFKLMKSKETTIKTLHNDIVNILREIEDKKCSLQRYQDEIEMIEIQEQSYRDELEKTDEFNFDEKTKMDDVSQLKTLNSVVSVINFMGNLNEVVLVLRELTDYLGKREAESKIVDEKIIYVKSIIAKLHGVMLELIASVNLEDCFEKKEIILSKLNDKDGYLMSEKERNVRNLEIANLQFDISFCQSECTSDEQALIDYNHRIDKLNADIQRMNNENKILQTQINELTLKKVYFINENSQSETDDISKEIKRKQKRLDANKKHVEKLIKFKTDIENAIRSIKKTRKNSESLKNDMEVILREKKELSKDLVDKYSLDEDRQQLLLIDLFIEMTKFAKGVLQQQYLKKLDEISVESFEPFIGVIGFYDYDKTSELVTTEFIETAKKSMDCMMNSKVNKDEDFIRILNSQGVKVTRFGKSLKTMEEPETISKTVRLAA